MSNRRVITSPARKELEQAKPLVEALEKIFKTKHILGCSDSNTKYINYCDCAENIAKEALSAWRKIQDEQ